MAEHLWIEDNFVKLGRKERDHSNDDQGVRLFTIMPAAIHLQIRGRTEKQVWYAGIGLDANQCKQIIATLQQFVSDMGKAD